MITSTTNERVKLAKALFQRKTRQEKGLFVVEGVRLAEEALRANVRPEFVFYTADLAERGVTGTMAFAWPGGDPAFASLAAKQKAFSEGPW